MTAFLDVTPCILVEIGLRFRIAFWLLLRDGIVQSVPSTADNFWYFSFPILFQIIPDSSTRPLWQTPTETHSSESGKNLARSGHEFFRRSISVILRRNFYIPQNFMTLGRRLYFPSEGSHVKNFVALKNLSPSVVFEPANLGSNGKLDNY
jgi:hypothetical protein